MASIPVSHGDNIIRTKGVNFPYDKHGLAHMLLKASQKHKSKIAQITADTGSCDTYEDLVQKSIRVALEMKSRGIKADDIVCFCSENQSDVFVAYFAALLVGAIVSALDTSLSESDMKHLLSQVSPKMMFVTSRCEEVIEDVLTSLNLTPTIVVFGQTNRNIHFDLFLVERDPDVEEAFTPYKVEDVFKTTMILFSSGSTGLPKGICLNHYSVMCSALDAMNEIKSNFVSIFLAFNSIYWVGTIQIFIGSIMAGTTRLLVPRFDIETLWTYIDTYKVNVIWSVPYQVTSILKSTIPDALSISSLKAIVIVGAKISIEQLELLHIKLPEIIISQTYGITEIGGSVLKPVLTVTRSKPKMVGHPRGLIWYKIVDPDNEKILGPNQPGELRLLTKLAMNGYYNLDSGSAWDSDGWLKTGDIFYYDEDYDFHFVDRLKGLIKYKGIHVLSTLLESILLQHPAIEQAVVIGLPDPDDEEHPMAVVILTDNAKYTSPEDLRRYVDEKVDDPKKLRAGVRIVDAFPLTASGKVSYRELKQQICEELNITL